MKELFKTLAIVTMLGFLAYCSMFLFQANKDKLETINTDTEAFEKEAEYLTRGVSKKMNVMMRNSKKVLRRAKNIKNIDDPYDGEEPPYGFDQDYEDYTDYEETPDRDRDYEMNMDELEDKLDFYNNKKITRPITKPKLTPSTTYFHIQLGKYGQKSSEIPSFDNLKDLGSIHSDLKGYATRVSMGNFTNRADAERLLKQIKNRGYKDAFIIKSSTPIREDLAHNELVGYMIQLLVVKEPKMQVLQPLNNLGTLHQQYVRTKDVNKILLGIYETEQEAKEILAQVKQKGFGKAFVKQIHEEEFDEMFKISS